MFNESQKHLAWTLLCSSLALTFPKDLSCMKDLYLDYQRSYQIPGFIYQGSYWSEMMTCSWCDVLVCFLYHRVLYFKMPDFSLIYYNTSSATCFSYAFSLLFLYLHRLIKCIVIILFSKTTSWHYRSVSCTPDHLPHPRFWLYDVWKNTSF